MAIRTLLADDHPIVRTSLRAELDKTGGFEVTAEASSPEELLTLIQRQPFDLLITDFSMPGGLQDGLTMLDEVHRLCPSLSIIVVTMITNPALLHSISQRDIAGLISKTDGLTELKSALRAHMSGERYVSSNVAALLNVRGNSHASSPSRVLTDREFEVLRMFVAGRTVSEIANLRGRSVKTISHQKIAAMAKLGLRNDPELYAYAHRHGLGE